jgi:hypothetical protein
VCQIRENWIKRFDVIHPVDFRRCRLRSIDPERVRQSNVVSQREHSGLDAALRRIKGLLLSGRVSDVHGIGCGLQHQTGTRN